MGGLLLYFVVEDRHELGKEQELHSYGVSKYFIEDYSVFMMRFKAEDGSTVYKPVILSQFANQNNLEELPNKKWQSKKYCTANWVLLCPVNRFLSKVNRDS
ncbi:protein kinase domain containing protein [Legionella pneumophila]|nr:protein kinase domain containing protein [Legionella pneumophila]